jgi:hypothetical protein
MLKMANSADYKTLGFSMVEQMKRDKFMNIRNEVRVEFIKNDYNSKLKDINDDILFKGKFNDYPFKIEERFKEAFDANKFVGTYFDTSDWLETSELISHFLSNQHLEASYNYFDKEVNSISDQVSNALIKVRLIGTDVMKIDNVPDIEFFNEEREHKELSTTLIKAIGGWSIHNEYFDKIESLTEDYKKLGVKIKETSNSIVDIMLENQHHEGIKVMDAYRQALVKESVKISKGYTILCRFLDLHVERTSILLGVL